MRCRLDLYYCWNDRVFYFLVGIKNDIVNDMHEAEEGKEEESCNAGGESTSRLHGFIFSVC